MRNALASRRLEGRGPIADPLLERGVGRSQIKARNGLGMFLFRRISQICEMIRLVRVGLMRGEGDKAKRLERAIDAILECVATAAGIPLEQLGRDDDLIDDLSLDQLELESLGMVIEEIFAIRVPDELWRSPLYRSAVGLAEWAIRQSDEAAWIEARRAGMRGRG